MKEIFTIMFWTTILISCFDNEKIELGSKYFENEMEIILNKSELNNSRFIKHSKIVNHRIESNYKFSINIPSRFEYCGKISTIFCPIGEPDEYYAIDTTLREELIIQIVTNKNDQKKYKLLFDEEHETEMEKFGRQHLMKFMELEQYDELPRRYLSINNSKFVGFGFNGYSKKGVPKSQYSIYSSSSKATTGIFYKKMGAIDEEVINELNYVMASMSLTLKK